MSKIILSNKEANNLACLIAMYPNQSEFTLEQSSGSGIGQTLTVSFKVLDDNDNEIADMKANITDYGVW